MQVQEQYRRPEYLTELRHYDLPCEGTTDRLYYEMPRLGRPKYRGTFRDKPFTVQRYYPGEDPRGKPVGFHGRVYYEDGPPAFKYDGPKKDELYWLERSPYLPSFPRSNSAAAGPPNERDQSMRDNSIALGHASGGRCSINGFNMSGTMGVPIPPPGSAPRAPSSIPAKASMGRSNARAVYNPDEDSQTIYTTSYTNPSKRQTLDGVGFL